MSVFTDSVQHFGVFDHLSWGSNGGQISAHYIFTVHRGYVSLAGLCIELSILRNLEMFYKVF